MDLINNNPVCSPGTTATITLEDLGARSNILSGAEQILIKKIACMVELFIDNK